MTPEQNVTTFKKAATDLDLRITTMTDDGVIGVVVGVDLKKNTSSYCYAFRVFKHWQLEAIFRRQITKGLVFAI